MLMGTCMLSVYISTEAALSWKLAALSIGSSRQHIYVFLTETLSCPLAALVVCSNSACWTVNLLKVACCCSMTVITRSKWLLWTLSGSFFSSRLLFVFLLSLYFREVSSHSLGISANFSFPPSYSAVGNGLTPGTEGQQHTEKSPFALRATLWALSLWESALKNISEFKSQTGGSNPHHRARLHFQNVTLKIQTESLS